MKITSSFDLQSKSYKWFLETLKDECSHYSEEPFRDIDEEGDFGEVPGYRDDDAIYWGTLHNYFEQALNDAAGIANVTLDGLNPMYVLSNVDSEDEGAIDEDTILSVLIDDASKFSSWDEYINNIRDVLVDSLPKDTKITSSKTINAAKDKDENYYREQYAKNRNKFTHIYSDNDIANYILDHWSLNVSEEDDTETIINAWTDQGHQKFSSLNDSFAALNSFDYIYNDLPTALSILREAVDKDIECFPECIYPLSEQEELYKMWYYTHVVK